MKEKALRAWRFVRPILFVVIVLTAFRSSIADWNDVPTGSMRPSILEGDRILVNKLAYDLKVPFTTWHLARWSEPKRGEVVIFYSPKDGTRLVKRVVGVPGDTVELRNERLYVNGTAAEYRPLAGEHIEDIPANQRQGLLFAWETTAAGGHPVVIDPQAPARRSFAPITLGDGQYFVMGDNRDYSFDSRYFGPVNRDRIVGRAWGVAGSLDVNNNWMPRWGRFFRGLP